MGNGVKGVIPDGVLLGNGVKGVIPNGVLSGKCCLKFNPKWCVKWEML